MFCPKRKGLPVSSTSGSPSQRWMSETADSSGAPSSQPKAGGHLENLAELRAASTVDPGLDPVGDGHLVKCDEGTAR